MKDSNQTPSVFSVQPGRYAGWLALGVWICIVLSLFSSSAVAEKGPIFRKSNVKEKVIALTFDDGPHPQLTPEILSILDEYQIKATFFVVGSNVDEYPEIFQKTIAAGHEIGNHTYTHIQKKQTTESDMRKEIELCEQAIGQLAETTPILFRPPGGITNRSTLRVADEKDLTIVLWDIDTRDWAHTPADQISRQILEQVSPGDIILMHDYIGRQSPTPQALRKVIPQLLAQGYRFVTISELLGMSSEA